MGVLGQRLAGIQVVTDVLGGAEMVLNAALIKTALTFKCWLTKNFIRNYGGPDGFRTQCLLLSDFLLITYVYAMYLLGFK